MLRHALWRLNPKSQSNFMADWTGEDRRTREGCLRVFIRSAGLPLGLLVDIQTPRSDRVVTTVAGSSSGYSDGTGTAAHFDSPSDLAIDRSGQVYVNDFNNARVRKITFQ